MDDLKEKLKSLPNPFKTSKFKGQGHKLGSGDASSSAPAKPLGVPRTGAAAERSLVAQRRQQEAQLKQQQEQDWRLLQQQKWSQGRGLSQPSSSSSDQPSPQPQSVQKASPPSRVEPGPSQAGEQAGQSGATSVTPLETAGKSDQSASAEFSPYSPFFGSGRSTVGLAQAEVPGTSGESLGSGSHALTQAADSLLSSPDSSGAVEILCKILSNIISDPTADKYRKLRLANPKIAETVGTAPGGLEFFQGVGFELVEEENVAGDKELVAVMKSCSEADLLLVREGLELLKPQVLSSPAFLPPGIFRKKEQGDSQVREAPAQPEPPVVRPPPRELRVYLPSADNVAARITVPDSFYNLTPAEVKAEQAARKRQLEDSKVLIPKSYKEKLAEANRRRYKAAIIRIQLPDGIVLQGVFSPAEPTSSIYEYVRECLKNPAQTFDLVQSHPMKNPVIPTSSSSGVGPITVYDAELVPAALIKLRSTSSDMPYTGLRDDLLVKAEPISSVPFPEVAQTP